jgi:hypothetical protein
MLMNGNKYILISPNLWKIISDNEKNKNENPILFSFMNNIITFFFENNETLKLKIKNQFFIFDKSSCYYKDNYFNEINEIYNSLESYYSFEKKFLTNLCENIQNSTNGFLVSESWLNSWKEYSNYENIKNKYFDKPQDNSNEIEKNIKNDIICFREENESIYEIPKESNIININKKEELESMLNNESLAIINSDFKNCFPYFKNETKLIEYSTFNNQIKIHLDQTIIFKSNNNIISKNYNIDLMDLKLLIKIFLFQNSFSNLVNNGNKAIKYKEKIKIFFINNKIIKQYKNHFEYNKLYEYLINNDLFKEIISEHNNHKKLDKLFMEQIIKNIPYKLIEKIKKLNNNFEKNKFGIHDKKLIVKEKSLSYIPFFYKLKYITEFEIVNEDIINLFIEKEIIQKEDVIESEYIINSRKLFIYFNYENNNFYQIGNINSNGEFIIEYVIQEYKKIIKMIL